MAFKLYPEQEKAVEQLSSGKVLRGDVGAGKTFTALSFYKKKYPHLDLYVITTAKKRDSGDWHDEAKIVGVELEAVDSWNSIKKYADTENSFFIFDEQRAVGYGTWAKNFIKIAKKNKWIFLSATPGDVWMDYLSLFIANGFYKNKTDFVNQHVEYNRFVSYPMISKYHNEGKLMRLRKQILVNMSVQRHTIRKREYVYTDYDQGKYQVAVKDRWNYVEDTPIMNVSELLQLVRYTVANSNQRQHEAVWQIGKKDKVVVFYNYNYELDILRKICTTLGKTYAEWNGHKHEPIPETEEWAYLVQYTSGSEGWNCTETDQMLFYSPNYSYRVTEQSEGRIDRVNTPFTELYYTYLRSDSDIDKSVFKAIHSKKTFNQKTWKKRMDTYGERERISS